MNESKRTSTGLEMLLTALAVGVLGNILLRETPWGLNAFLFVAVFTAAMLALTYRHRPDLVTVRTLALKAAMVFFASMFVIRDSIELRVYDTIAIIVIMGVLVLPNFGVNQRFAGVFHYAAGFIWAGISSVYAMFMLLVADIDWKAIPGNRLSRNVFAVMRGLAIALPLVLIFGGLFIAADAAFEDFANRVFHFELETVISHLVLTSFLAWLVAGYFRGALVTPFPAAVGTPSDGLSVIPANEEGQPANERQGSVVEHFTSEPTDVSNALPDGATILDHINRSDPPHTDQIDTNSGGGPAIEDDPNVTSKRDWQNFDNIKFPAVFTLGTVETVIILGLLNVLFLSFVIFQLPYLFGGFEFVQNTPDLKLADFARRGFGELVAVSFLVLPLLLASHWLLRRDNPKNETIFRILAGVQIGLLFVIMASAMQRLVLLTGELGYGWTTVRFYPMVVMIWLAVVFVWFGWTVLRGRRSNFAWGALWSAILILAATNLMNPDDFIARKNIQLMQQGRDYDARYNTAELSDDAIPVVAGSLHLMSEEDRCRSMVELYGRLLDARGEGDLRSLNWSREAAYNLLEPISGTLANGPGCGEYRPGKGKFLGEYGR